MKQINSLSHYFILLIFNIFILIILIDLNRLFSQILIFHYTLRQTEYLKKRMETLDSSILTSPQFQCGLKTLVKLSSYLTYGEIKGLKTYMNF